jgi:hypothetical protein
MHRSSMSFVSLSVAETIWIFLIFSLSHCSSYQNRTSFFFFVKMIRTNTNLIHSCHYSFEIIIFFWSLVWYENKIRLFNWTTSILFLFIGENDEELVHLAFIQIDFIEIYFIGTLNRSMKKKFTVLVLYFSIFLSGWHLLKSHLYNCPVVYIELLHRCLDHRRSLHMQCKMMWCFSRQLEWNDL